MTIQQKAKLILAGLATVPAVGLAITDATIQNSPYRSPYSEPEQEPATTPNFTGLTREELRDAEALVKTLNRLDVVSVKDVNLSKARGVPYRYNIPEQSDIQEARIQNLERLAKLRAMIEAAR